MYLKDMPLRMPYLPRLALLKLKTVKMVSIEIALGSLLLSLRKYLKIELWNVSSLKFSKKPTNLCDYQFKYSF